MPLSGWLLVDSYQVSLYFRSQPAPDVNPKALFFLFKVYLKKKDNSPSKISTKLKEMQISYNLFQAQHRQEIHTHYLVFHVGFPFILLRQWFPQVSSEIKKHGPWQFVLQLQLVLWKYLTSFPEISAFWFRTLEESELWALPGTGLVYSWRSSVRYLFSLRRNNSPLFFLRFFTQKSSSL